MKPFLMTATMLIAAAGGSRGYSETTPSRPSPPATARKDHSVNWRGSGGWGTGCSYCQGFDLKNSTSVTGIVERLEAMTPAPGMRQGVHLLLKTDKDVISVHLGPAWYVEHQDLHIKANDKIKVTGVRTQWDGTPAIVAFEIEKGGKTLSLRDAQGRPAWAGWRGVPMRGRMQ